MQHQSPSKKALKRLLRNKPAVFGLMVLTLALFLSIFGYWIAPDSTPNANDQTLQLETKPPGFEIQMLNITQNRKPDETGWFKALFSGQPSNHIAEPIVGYEFNGDDIVLEVYTGSNYTTKQRSVNTYDVIFDVKEYQDDCIIDFNDEKHCLSQTERQQIIESEFLSTKTYLLGTDNYGRDVLSRLIIGVRVSLSVGFIAVIIALLIGSFLGALAGYFGGWIDQAIMWLINVFWSIPTLLLAMGLAISVDKISILGFDGQVIMIYIAVGLTMWVSMARIVRGQFLSLKHKEFVEAAHSLGFSHFRTIFVHIFPNIIGPVMVILAANFATAILVEAGLSLMGLGIKPPTPSWGTMLNEYRNYIGGDKGYLALFPGFCIMILALSFNLIGNGLRDALDVKAVD